MSFSAIVVVLMLPYLDVDLLFLPKNVTELWMAIQSVIKAKFALQEIMSVSQIPDLVLLARNVPLLKDVVAVISVTNERAILDQNAMLHRLLEQTALMVYHVMLAVNA